MSDFYWWRELEKQADRYSRKKTNLPKQTRIGDEHFLASYCRLADVSPIIIIKFYKMLSAEWRQLIN